MSVADTLCLVLSVSLLPPSREPDAPAGMNSLWTTGVAAWCMLLMTAAAAVAEPEAAMATPVCAAFSRRKTCLAAGSCFWNKGSCSDDTESVQPRGVGPAQLSLCDEITEKALCKKARCFFDRATQSCSGESPTKPDKPTRPPRSTRPPTAPVVCGQITEKTACKKSRCFYQKKSGLCLPEKPEKLDKPTRPPRGTRPPTTPAVCDQITEQRACKKSGCFYQKKSGLCLNEKPEKPGKPTRKPK